MFCLDSRQQLGVEATALVHDLRPGEALLQRLHLVLRNLQPFPIPENAHVFGHGLLQGGGYAGHRFGFLARLIIGQIVGCWLRLSFVEYTYGRALVTGTLTLNQGDFWERRLSAAQRRYLRAIETLARVRRMNLPAMQVNIAAQQVNQVNTRG